MSLWQMWTGTLDPCLFFSLLSFFTPFRMKVRNQRVGPAPYEITRMTFLTWCHGAVFSHPWSWCQLVNLLQDSEHQDALARSHASSGPFLSISGLTMSHRMSFQRKSNYILPGSTWFCDIFFFKQLMIS